jgi:hypothetical protein
MTPEQERQYQEVRERLISKTCRFYCSCDQNKNCFDQHPDNETCDSVRRINVFLSDPAIRIEDADQSLPENPYWHIFQSGKSFAEIYELGQKSMAGFVRVLPREE